ncbi:50S ribosomal protein L21 [Chloroflexota bacterium]
MYAIVESGGKQYRVAPGETVCVEKLPVESDTVELSKVHLIADGDKVTVGKPLIDGAKVVATVLDQGRGDKIIVFKYKPKTRYRKKTGHRQPYTKLAIKEIVAG